MTSAFFKDRLLHGGETPAKAEYILFAALTLIFGVLFVHPDLTETARHGYILIRSTLDGDFFNFFENTLSRSYGYGYVNAAHYNILMYILYAVWELPVFLAERLLQLEASDAFLALWCKPIGVGFYLGCGVLVQRLARQLALPGAPRAALCFLLDPVCFFTTVIMGQYDSICLFFVLWALCFYFEGRLWRFALVMGAGLVFKFFPVFLLIPLLLLREKKPLRLAGYGAAALWLYLPATALFHGRDGDAGFFNSLMARRLFDPLTDTGRMDAARFGLVMVLVCAAAYLLRPVREQLPRIALYLCLTVLCALFFIVEWHPQWLILLAPFILLTTLQQQDGRLFFWVELAGSIGFLLVTAFGFPGQLEANLLDGGILPLLTGAPVYTGGLRTLDFYYTLIPYLTDLAPLLFYGALLCQPVFKLPLDGGTLADRLSRGSLQPLWSRARAWGHFLFAVGGFWLVPMLFSLLNTVGVL